MHRFISKGMRKILQKRMGVGGPVLRQVLKRAPTDAERGEIAQQMELMTPMEREDYVNGIINRGEMPGPPNWKPTQEQVKVMEEVEQMTEAGVGMSEIYEKMHPKMKAAKFPTYDQDRSYCHETALKLRAEGQEILRMWEKDQQVGGPFSALPGFVTGDKWFEIAFKYGFFGDEEWEKRGYNIPAGLYEMFKLYARSKEKHERIKMAKVCNEEVTKQKLADEEFERANPMEPEVREMLDAIKEVIQGGKSRMIRMTLKAVRLALQGWLRRRFSQTKEAPKFVEKEEPVMSLFEEKSTQLSYASPELKRAVANEEGYANSPPTPLEVFQRNWFGWHWKDKTGELVASADPKLKHERVFTPSLINNLTPSSFQYHLLTNPNRGIIYNIQNPSTVMWTMYFGLWAFLVSYYIYNMFIVDEHVVEGNVFVELGNEVHSRRALLEALQNPKSSAKLNEEMSNMSPEELQAFKQEYMSGLSTEEQIVLDEWERSRYVPRLPSSLSSGGVPPDLKTK